MPPEIDDTQTEEVVVDDRRAQLEAAFDAASADPAAAPPPPAAPKPPAPPAAPADPTAPAPPAAPKPGEAAAPPPPADPTDKPPQSWKPAQREKWAKIDPDIRQEILRRDTEITRTLSETAQARQLAQGFQQVVQPFMARIQAAGVHPLVAIQELLRADHILTSATPAKKAEYMATLINQYEIDIQALDTALAGKSPQDTQESRIEQLLNARLQPILQAFEQQNQQRSQFEQQTTEQQIQAMAKDKEKFPDFEAVREDMADIIDLSSKKGVALTLEQAYTRAVAMNPEISARVAQEAENQRKTAAAREANLRAQRARIASSSVGGAPNIAVIGSTPGQSNDRRATIAAAMDQLEGR